MKNRLQSIREFQERDAGDVVGVWHRSGKAAYSYLPMWRTLTFDDAHKLFCEVILRQCKIWVGILDDEIVAFLAMNGSYIDRMYVDPREWRKGWGTRLLAFAKGLHPEGLELHTHQENQAARQLYEKHGFKAVRFGMSPSPESAPDVEYHWRPDGINADPLLYQDITS